MIFFCNPKLELMANISNIHGNSINLTDDKRQEIKTIMTNILSEIKLLMNTREKKKGK